MPGPKLKRGKSAWKIICDRSVCLLLFSGISAPYTLEAAWALRIDAPRIAKGGPIMNLPKPEGGILSEGRLP
jgi:hypothetical protein